MTFIDAEILDFVAERPRQTVKGRREEAEQSLILQSDITDVQKKAMLFEAKEIVARLSEELEVYEEPKWKSPMTWMQYSVAELSRGDAIRIEEKGILNTYIYLKKMAWWRNKNANVLIGHKDNPDKQKRIGESDFVFAFKGYINSQQLARLGVDLW